MRVWDVSYFIMLFIRYFELSDYSNKIFIESICKENMTDHFCLI